MSNASKPDICIIGAGPAGLATALTAAGNGKSVLLAESGTGTNDLSDLCIGSVADAAQASDRRDFALVKGPSLFSPDYLQSGRARIPGGSSTMWGIRSQLSDQYRVRMVRPSREDFAEDDRFDIPAWPVPAEEIEAYLDQACEFLEIPGSSQAYGATGALNFDHQILSPARFYFPEGAVIHTAKVQAAAAHANIDWRTGWTLISMEREKSGDRISRLRFSDITGRTFDIEPSTVVIATGGIENSRILLNAEDAGQLPDPHGNLGRWFMDHPHVSLGTLDPRDSISNLGRFHDFQTINGNTSLGVYELTPEAARTNNLLRFSVTMVGAPRYVVSRAATALASLANLKFENSSPGALAEHFGNLLLQPVTATRHYIHKKTMSHSTALGGWSNPETAIGDIEVLKVETMMEQRPSPDNRVRLDTERDRYGARRARLQWSWSKPEVDSYFRSIELARSEFTRADAGKFIAATELGCGSVPRGGTGWHQMGGTRMSSAPEDGVVDANCRHHQTENLYVTGSSVFPSSIGYANPTLTVIAVALRLGVHLS